MQIDGLNKNGGCAALSAVRFDLVPICVTESLCSLEVFLHATCRRGHPECS